MIGTGHGTCTCQGAAFEYIYNVDHVLREAGVRDLARIVWISNEYELGDFGMGGVHIERGGYITNGKTFAESLLDGRNGDSIIAYHANAPLSDWNSVGRLPSIHRIYTTALVHSHAG